MLKKSFLASVPVMAGYVVLGIGFGMLLYEHGYGPVWAFFMSVFIYAGSMQYVTIDLMSTGVGLITAFLTTIAVNARHIFYGLSMLDRYRNVKHKPLLIWTLTDETYSLVCGREPEHRLGVDGNTEEGQKAIGRFCLLVSLFDYSYWLIGSMIGSFLGLLLPINTKGIDFSLTALFITVFVEQWLTTKNHLSALVGVACSVVCLLIFGSESFLIPTMVLIMVSLFLLRKQKGITNEREEEKADA